MYKILETAASDPIRAGFRRRRLVFKTTRDKPLNTVGQLGLQVLVVKTLLLKLPIATLDLVDTSGEIDDDLLELLSAHFEVKAMFHLEIDETRGQEHQVMGIGVHVVLGHLGSLVLVHAANVAE